jgi:hypothetical protein
MYSYINRPLRPNNTSSNLGGISLYHGITILDPTRFRSPLHLGCATGPLHHHNSPPLLCYKADNQGDGSSPSNQQKADTTTTTKRKEEEWAAVLAALTDARKALEEQHLRECVAALALQEGGHPNPRASAARRPEGAQVQ